jgi:large subunit ribosomal protein L22
MTKNKDLNQVKAIYRNLRSSPRKINNILKSIRDKNANVAMRDVEYTDKRVASKIKKT